MKANDGENNDITALYSPADFVEPAKVIRCDPAGQAVRADAHELTVVVLICQQESWPSVPTVSL